MPFHALLSAQRIGLVKDRVNRDGALDAASHLLAQPGDGLGFSIEQITTTLRERERWASTAIGHGVAIPHARIEHIQHSRGAFVRLCTPVDFDALDNQPVDLVFALAVPAHYAQEHLEQLADVAAHFSNATFRQSLRDARSPDELCRLLLSD